MTDPSPLDTAHAAMDAAPEDARARLAFHACLADSALFLLLEEDGETPAQFPTADGPVVLAFDREDRLTGFAGRAVSYAELPGRAVVGMLAGQGVGLGVNLDVAPSSTLLAAEAVDWLAALLDGAPSEHAAALVELGPPDQAAPALLASLDRALARAGGLADHAVLAHAIRSDGQSGPVLAIFGAPDDARPALARAIRDAVVFSGEEERVLDVLFPDPTAAERFAAVGLRFDIPEAQTASAKATPMSAPGSDPDRPPRLR